MWVVVACIGLGISGLAAPRQSDGGSLPFAAKQAVLEIMSQAQGDRTLQLDHHWGGIVGSHVFLDDHDGPFEAIAEPAGNGVRVTFKGWEEHPFVATASILRIVYHRPESPPVDLVIEAMPAGQVRISPRGRSPIQGKRVSVRLGGPEVRFSR